MTRIDSTKVKWRVQTKAKNGRWINRRLFETRSAARYEAACIRDGFAGWMGFVAGLGFGNTRVVRHISGKGRAS